MERRQVMSIRAISEKLRPDDWLTAWQQRREQRARRRLLAQIDTTLLWHDGRLIDTASGESQVLAAASGTQAEQLAAAAARLLAARKPAGILLLVPPSHVVATPFNLAIRGGPLLRSALQLQLPQLIPACEEPLSLALDARRSKGIALWLRQSLADSLHAAFEARGLPLVALMPRPLAQRQSLPCLDVDADTRTLISGEQGSVDAWLSIAERDLAQADFARQWDAQVGANAGRATLLDASYWRAQRRVFAPEADYCFIPQAMRAAGQADATQRARRMTGAALAACAVLLVLPFLYNAWRLHALEGSLEDAMQASAAARASQAAVVAMEASWAAVTQHPQPDIAAVLQTLDRYIEGGLSSFSIERGVIDISGYVPDPALLVEQLAELESFRAVVQSRSSSGGGEGARGARFGIRMQLTEADYDAYEANLPRQEEAP